MYVQLFHSERSYVFLLLKNLSSLKLKKKYITILGETVIIISVTYLFLHQAWRERQSHIDRLNIEI